MKTIAAVCLFVAFQDKPFEAFGTMGADGFTPDGKKEAIKIESKEKLEGRVWLKGVLKDGALKVADVERFPKDLAAAADGKAFSLTLTGVSPWCDHMPMMREGERRQYLTLSVTLKNKTGKPLEVDLPRAFFSFDEKLEGSPVTGISVRGEDGAGSGVTKISLKAGEERQVPLRGDNLYDEDRHDQKLFVTIVAAAGGERLLVRAAGVVLMTQ